ncbi:MAG: DinB family protein [Flavobacteriaceae bacterium]|nr:DinB family protein [Flavobacteriaceae bacterium]
MSILQENEYAPFYEPYIQAILANNKTLLDNLFDTSSESLSLLKNLPSEKLLFSYAKGKWTIKEIIQHLIDAERIMAYRALRFARTDMTELPGFDENNYVLSSNGNKRTIGGLLKEMKLVRKTTILLFKNFEENDLMSLGVANGSNMSVRALGYIIAGHQLHHMKIIQERYL